MNAAGLDGAAGERARRKIARRILPFLFVLYIIAYLDRANVAFARLPMSAELGFSDAVYGFGAGIFFLGYFLLEIPGALLVERWSARRWMARILVTWGLCTVLVGFIRTAPQFYTARFLLGAAEAGFFPGIIVYLTHWFRESDRARAMAGFATAAPVALTIGGPLSALILQMHWLGISSWRWVFILQGLPAVLFGVITLFYLTDRPGEARWLEAEERESIRTALDLEVRTGGPETPWWRVLRDPSVLLLCAAQGFATIGGYGFIFWLPGTLKTTMALTPGAANVASALPFALAVLTSWLVGRSSDRRAERKLHACVPMLGAGLFFALSAIPGQPPVLVLVWLSLTGGCAFGWIPGFWVLVTLIHTGSARAAAIGLINSVGNLGGFAGPAIIGQLITRTQSPRSVALVVSVSYAMAALLTSLVRTRPKRDAAGSGVTR